MGKALESGADAVIFDLEDSVPLAAKAEARALVAKSDRRRGGQRAAGRPIFVRDQCRRDRNARRRSRRRRASRPGRDHSGQGRDRRRGASAAAALLDRLEAAREASQPGSVEIILHDRKRAGRLSLLSTSQGFAARRQRLLRQRARRRSADRSRLQLVDRRHRAAVRALQGAARHARGGQDCIRSTASSAISSDEAGLDPGLAPFRAPGLRRPHGDPSQADRAGAAGLCGARSRRSSTTSAW